MSKPTLLMLHGALGTKDFCLPLLPYLTQHFQVIHFDFKGHGEDNWAGENLSIELFAAQIQAFLQTNEIEKPFVFGYSMGGYTAMYLEKKYPNTFAGIITFGTIYNWTPENAKRQVAQMNWEKIQQKVPHFAQVMRQIHGEKVGNLFSVLGNMLLGMGENPLLTSEDFTKIDIPVWVGVGDKDNNVSIDETLDVYRKLAKGSLFVLPNTPHAFEKVDIEAISNIIIQFCDKKA